MSRTVYLGHYGDPARRAVSPACVAVMDYLIDTLVSLGEPPVVVSPARPRAPGEPATEMLRASGVPCHYTSSHCGRLPGGRRARARALEAALLRLLRDGDTLLVYHSPLLSRVVERVRRVRRVRLILQVCEVYADALGGRARPVRRARELAYLRRADGYIFSSGALAATLGGGRPHAVCLGSYRVVEVSAPPSDGMTHMIYAGTLDPRKGGAETAVAVAEHLPADYHLHILGFGNESEVAALKRRLSARGSSPSRATVTYDGVLSGAAFSAALARCRVGLCTQDPAGDFNETSFPSKILTYMAHGLRVVSTRVRVVEASAVSGDVIFADDPAALAAAIRRAVAHPTGESLPVVEPRARIRALDAAFVRSLGALLESVTEVEPCAPAL